MKLKLFEIKKLRSPLSVGLRKFAKQYFISNLLGRSFNHPSLGKVSISWSFWRHLTSGRRSQKHIWESLSLLPIVQQSLEKPRSFTGLRRLWNIKRGSNISEGRLLIFDSYGFDEKYSSVHCKIRTVIRERLFYSKNWQDEPQCRNKLIRELFLESIYEKTKTV